MMLDTFGPPRFWKIAAAVLLLGRSASAAPVTYLVAPGPAQNVRFDARTQTERYGGQTTQVSGQIQVDWAHPTAAPSARFEASLASLSTGNGARDSNMRRRFLQTNKFSTATFTLNALDAPAGPVRVGQSVQGVARGSFTLHGVTRAISPTVTVTREAGTSKGGDALHLVARFVVRLKDYAIGTPRLLFLVVRQEHPILVDVRAFAR